MLVRVTKAVSPPPVRHHLVRLNPLPPPPRTHSQEKRGRGGWVGAGGERGPAAAAQVNATPPHGGQSERRLSAARTALSGVHRHGAVDDREGDAAGPPRPPDPSPADGGGTTTAGWMTGRTCGGGDAAAATTAAAPRGAGGGVVGE